MSSIVVGQLERLMFVVNSIQHQIGPKYNTASSREKSRGTHEQRHRARRTASTAGFELMLIISSVAHVLDLCIKSFKPMTKLLTLKSNKIHEGRDLVT